MIKWKKECINTTVQWPASFHWMSWCNTFQWKLQNALQLFECFTYIINLHTNNKGIEIQDYNTTKCKCKELGRLLTEQTQIWSLGPAFLKVHGAARIRSKLYVTNPLKLDQYYRVNIAMKF